MPRVIKKTSRPGTDEYLVGLLSHYGHVVQECYGRIRIEWETIQDVNERLISIKKELEERGYYASNKQKS